MYKYLTYIINPYTVSKDAIFKLRDKESVKDVSIKDISQELSTIVTYDFWMLVPYFQNLKLTLPKSIIDVSQVGRLLIGQSHLEYSKSLPWSIWKLIRPFYSKKEDYYAIKRLYFKRQEDSFARDPHELLAILSYNLNLLWKKQLHDLKMFKEYNRYFSIEKPMNELLLGRQYKGIKIDEKVLLSKLDHIDGIIYKASKELRDKWGIPDIYDKDNLANKLKKSGFIYLADNVSSALFDDLAEIGSEVSDILKQYKIYKRGVADKSALLKFGAIGCGRSYPIFDPIGTVTGRALVKTPNIQQLHKTSRDVIISDCGYSLLYPDYAQFEPGILADDSKDLNLISNYNSGDVYNTLSLKLFGNIDRRSLAKKIFLAFSFGMSKPNLVNLLTDITRSDKKLTRKIIDSFFDKFENIQFWKNQLQYELIKYGKIATRDGNYRYRKNIYRKTLTHEEQRWVISQRVQGTASLILKKAILEISKRLKNAQLLVPMHDAALYQVPKKEVAVYKRKIEDIFITIFRSECPLIYPRVTFNKFADHE